MSEKFRNPQFNHGENIPQELRQLISSSLDVENKFLSLNKQEQAELAEEFSASIAFSQLNGKEHELFDHLYENQQQTRKKALGASA